VEVVRLCFVHGTAVTKEEGVKVFIFVTFETRPGVADRLFDGEGRSAEAEVIVEFVPYF
jgi:hypothetical protein